MSNLSYEERLAIITDEILRKHNLKHRSTVAADREHDRQARLEKMKRLEKAKESSTPKILKFITSKKLDTDIGVGDTLERLIASVGGRKFKKLAKWLGIGCGCEDRQQWLNQRWPY